MTDTILDTGRNCWRREHADRLTVLVNGAPYFAAVKRALLAARQQVFIVGWDIDSRIRLERRDPMPDVPNTLLELIDHVARARPELKIRLLIWDFTLLYAADREPLPAVKINWRTPANVTVEFDDVLPLGGAQHQKIVVVDDRLAFVGGLDLTEGRWDTAEHAENDPGRVGCDGQPYGPYHDAMAMFDGDAAAAIGELARFRWEAATGIRVPAPHRDANGDPWPDGVEPAMRNITVAIARTVPPLNGTDAIQEIQSLLLDGISAARDLIFIENQYLTARCIVDALCDRLA
jgi:phosphatidylserine/phosphatidylglycerophosphate/cardiolipin synthase-like enzyme